MMTDDGTYLIKRREGSSTQGVSEKTPNAAVKKPDAGGIATNALEVRVKRDKIDFVINGTVVTPAKIRRRRKDRWGLWNPH